MKILNSKRRPALNSSIKPTKTTEKELSTGRLRLSTFNTPLGWMGLLGVDDKIVGAYVGHGSAMSIKESASSAHAKIVQGDWSPDVRSMLEAYADGEIIDFADVELQLPPMTKFRHLIIMATRQVRYGETTSYGELAQRIGHARAARAVGTVMSSNRFPILIPCHRVMAAGGRLGGYTCPSGLDMKCKLLELETQGRGLSFSNQKPKWMRD